jgi:hypothetical protein
VLDGFGNLDLAISPAAFGYRQVDRYRDYESAITGRGVVVALLATSVFLGQARNMMLQNYGRAESPTESADEQGGDEP